MWRNFRFLHIFHVEKCEITSHVEKFQISPHLSCEINPHVMKFQISPHLSCIKIWNFSTWQIFLHGHCPWCPWQIWGMQASLGLKALRSIDSIALALKVPCISRSFIFPNDNFIIMKQKTITVDGWKWYTQKTRKSQQNWFCDKIAHVVLCSERERDSNESVQLHAYWVNQTRKFKRPHFALD